jgi:hypothetical protein
VPKKVSCRSLRRPPRPPLRPSAEMSVRVVVGEEHLGPSNERKTPSNVRALAGKRGRGLGYARGPNAPGVRGSVGGVGFREPAGVGTPGAAAGGAEPRTYTYILGACTLARIFGDEESGNS